MTTATTMPPPELVRHSSYYRRIPHNNNNNRLLSLPYKGQICMHPEAKQFIWKNSASAFDINALFISSSSSSSSSASSPSSSISSASSLSSSSLSPPSSPSPSLPVSPSSAFSSLTIAATTTTTPKSSSSSAASSLSYSHHHHHHHSSSTSLASSLSTNNAMECTNDTLLLIGDEAKGSVAAAVMVSPASTLSPLTPPTPKKQSPPSPSPQQRLPSILLSSRRPWLQHSDLKPILLRMEQILHKRPGGYQAAEDALIYITSVDCLIHLLLHGETEVQFPPSMLEYIGLGCVYLHLKMTHEIPLGRDTERCKFDLATFWDHHGQKERMSKKDFGLLLHQLCKYFEYDDMTRYSVAARHIYTFAGMYHPYLSSSSTLFQSFREQRPEYRHLLLSSSREGDEKSQIIRYEAILSVMWNMMTVQNKQQPQHEKQFQALMFILTTTESIRLETALKEVIRLGKLK